MELVENKLVEKELNETKKFLIDEVGVIDSGVDDIPSLDPESSVVLAVVSPEEEKDELVKIMHGLESLIYNGYYASDGINEIPDAPGIYTVWARPNDLFCDDPQSHEVVPVYVGQSTSLQRRANPKTHQKIKKTLCFPPYMCWIVWTECKAAMLDFAECHYIAKLRPRLNFGNKAKWFSA